MFPYTRNPRTHARMSAFHEGTHEYPNADAVFYATELLQLLSNLYTCKHDLKWRDARHQVFKTAAMTIILTIILTIGYDWGIHCCSTSASKIVALHCSTGLMLCSGTGFLDCFKQWLRVKDFFFFFSFFLFLLFFFFFFYKPCMSYIITQTFTCDLMIWVSSWFDCNKTLVIDSVWNVAN